ncbi:hypothetical protein Q8F55_001700 [Vanrija albida]|uniref:Uncharacterized protein n=1 Tax=Vanrija albida TaxID=181172 RepID=A0ABR3Q7W6_9TREE
MSSGESSKKYQREQCEREHQRQRETARTLYLITPRRLPGVHILDLPLLPLPRTPPPTGMMATLPLVDDFDEPMDVDEVYEVDVRPGPSHRMASSSRYVAARRGADGSLPTPSPTPSPLVVTPELPESPVDATPPPPLPYAPPAGVGDETRERMLANLQHPWARAPVPPYVPRRAHNHPPVAQYARTADGGRVRLPPHVVGGELDGWVEQEAPASAARPRIGVKKKRERFEWVEDDGEFKARVQDLTAGVGGVSKAFRRAASGGSSAPAMPSPGLCGVGEGPPTFHTPMGFA